VSRTSIWQEVRRLNEEQGITVFLTTQYLEEADRLADRIAIIDGGALVAEGTPRELKRRVGDEVVDLQFEDARQATRAGEVLTELAPQRQISGSELRVYAAHAAEIVPPLVRRLDESGVLLRGLSVAQPTLDDVFLRLTGKQLPASSDGRSAGSDPALSPAGAEADG
jgi:ABC-2 type transport system ATP-binding protein